MNKTKKIQIKKKRDNQNFYITIKGQKIILGNDALNKIFYKQVKKTSQQKKRKQKLAYQKSSQGDREYDNLKEFLIKQKIMDGLKSIQQDTKQDQQQIQNIMKLTWDKYDEQGRKIGSQEIQGTQEQIQQIQQKQLQSIQQTNEVIQQQQEQNEQLEQQIITQKKEFEDQMKELNEQFQVLNNQIKEEHELFKQDTQLEKEKINKQLDKIIQQKIDVETLYNQSMHQSFEIYYQNNIKKNIENYLTNFSDVMRINKIKFPEMRERIIILKDEKHELHKQIKKELQQNKVSIDDFNSVSEMILKHDDFIANIDKTKFIEKQDEDIIISIQNLDKIVEILEPKFQKTQQNKNTIQLKSFKELQRISESEEHQKMKQIISQFQEKRNQIASLEKEEEIGQGITDQELIQENEKEQEQGLGQKFLNYVEQKYRNGTSNFQLQDLANKLNIKNFLGVFMKDDKIKIPQNKKDNFSFIINTSKRNNNEDQKHWLSFFFNLKDNKIYYYDSLNQKKNLDFAKQFVQQILKNIDYDFIPKLYYNKEKDQNYDSTLCGFYSIHFLKLITQGNKKQKKGAFEFQNVGDEELIKKYDKFIIEY